MHLELGDRRLFEPFDENQIARREYGKLLLKRRFGRTAQFMQQRPSLIASKQYFLRAGLAMPPGILAGTIEIKIVMGVFDHGHAQPFANEQGNQFLDQRRLARTGITGKSKYFHLTIACAKPPPRVRKLVACP